MARNNLQLALRLFGELNKIQCGRRLPLRPGREKAPARFSARKGGGKAAERLAASLCGVIAARVLLDLPAAAGNFTTKASSL